MVGDHLVFSSMTARSDRFSYRSPTRASLGLHLLHLDMSSDALERIHHALETEIARGERRLERAEREGTGETYDWLVDDECDQVEELLGMAFVAAQPFINRIRTHFSLINTICKDDFGPQFNFFAVGGKVADLLKRGELIPGKSMSVVEAIYAVGNFWKHSDEWPRCEQNNGKYIAHVWDMTRLKDVQKTTVDVVLALGLTLGSTGNLRTAAKAIGVEKYSNLSLMRKPLQVWAQDVYDQASNELEALTAGLSPRRSK